jgi:hypothetical protein
VVTLFVRHKVADYDAWRRVYDGFGPVQQRFGVQQQAVYRAVEDPTDITVTHEFADGDTARAFAGSTELHDAMGKAGVQGAPTVWFTSRA